MEWYEYWLWGVFVLTIFGSMATINNVGKVKEATTGLVASIVVVINVITLIALWNLLIQ